MPSVVINHVYLFLAIGLAVYSQSVIRWRIGLVKDIPDAFFEKLYFIFIFLFEPWVMSSILATFFAGVLWVAALSYFELNYAYPWMALIFIIMTFIGVFFFGESINVNKVSGTLLVVVGLILVARS